MGTSTATPAAPAATDEWHTSRTGQHKIRLHGTGTDREVYTLEAGTHDIRRTRRFTGPNADAQARGYANTLWAAL